MRTNVILNDILINQAMNFGNLSSKTEAIHVALREFVEKRNQQKIIKLFGTIELAHDFESIKAVKLS